MRHRKAGVKLGRERDERTALRRILVSPTRRATYLLGTIAGQVLIAMAQMLLLVGLARWR